MTSVRSEPPGRPVFSLLVPRQSAILNRSKIRMAILGCIADDFTGGTDLANNLVKSGFRTIQTIGIPTSRSSLSDADAIVVALKTRTCPADEAIAASEDALSWLQSFHCRQYYFKYCSTFDSTPAGNIGPVIEILMKQLGETFSIACPAFPDNGRTLYRGHLFVHDQLLNESGMQHHPLTPMTDPNILRLLRAQTKLKIGLIRLHNVRAGTEAIASAFTVAKKEGVQIALTDATTNEDLAALAAAAHDLKLITGGSGLALMLGQNFGLNVNAAVELTSKIGPVRRAILAGSCSQITLRQIELAKQTMPHLRITPIDLAETFEETLRSTIDWTRSQKSWPLLIYTSAGPEDLGATHVRIGRQAAGELCERFLAKLALALAEEGYNQMIIAGGETAGATVGALEIDTLRIGPEIDPGVPWTLASGKRPDIALALKSGNFGSERFFLDAWRLLA